MFLQQFQRRQLSTAAAGAIDH